MSYFILSTPLGVIIGYILTAFVNNHASWEWAFYIMSFNMLVVAIGMMSFNKHYINYDMMLKQFAIIKKERAKETELESGQSSFETETTTEKKKGTIATLWHLKNNLIFMVCICGLTCLYFIITNIQFWVTLYFINIIGATESMA
jgi:sugar phosphate permease